MNKKTKIIGWISMFTMLAAALIGQATAIEFEIDVKPEFRVGEIVYFNYTIALDNDEYIRYAPSVECQGNLLSAPIQIMLAPIKAGIPLKERYEHLPIDETIEPQTCTATLEIIEPQYIKNQKEFKIITNPSFSFELETCKDQSCKEKSKVFIRDEDIYFNYVSEVENPSITATLTFPDNKQQELALPTSIKAEQIGTYELEVTASKEGYKKVIKKEQFGVIEKEANIPYTQPEGIKKFNWLYIIISIVILIIIGIILYLIKRRGNSRF